ncbi:Heparanase [Chionoecetes opilio]|uniref:Heparanase n=1 Tax=Chionoecetes opilio TaxID=41210 RepID=A0A8J5CDY8_CHIOP|nr:Heparanase [Chionoecetes opilio]
MSPWCCVMVVLVGVWCAVGSGVVGVGGGVEGVNGVEGVVGGIDGIGGVETPSHLSPATTHVSPLPLKTCREFNGLLRLLKGALEDLRALQETPYAGLGLLRTGGGRRARVRAKQWAGKLQRRLLRLCPLQLPAFFTPGSRASHKCWARAGGEYLRAVALHGERASRGLPLRRQKLSRLLDIFLSLFPDSEATTTFAPSTQNFEEPKKNINETVLVEEEEERVVEVEEGVVQVEEEEVEEDVVEVKVDVEEVLQVVPDTFLSLALSPRLMQRGWSNFNTSSPLLLSLVRALSPAVLRVGGSAANFVTYDPTPEPLSEGHRKGGHLGHRRDEGGLRRDEEGRDRHHDIGRGRGGDEIHAEEDMMDDLETTDEEEEDAGRCEDSQLSTTTFTNFTITRTDWTRLLHFTEAVGMRLLFDLNQFYRGPGDSWDPSNGRLLLRDACTEGFTSMVWQLGNEPNSYKHKFGFVLTGEQTARDYEALKTGPPQHLHHHHHHNTTGTTTDEGAAGVGIFAMDYLKSFLSALTFDPLALTWHQYYLNGHEAVVADFMDPAVMNQLAWEVAQVVAVRDHLAAGRPIWLTESGSAWGGGAPGLSNAFVSGFSWLDKLGVAAAGGVAVVARQTLYQACYALLDPHLRPYPDYWLSVLYKRLVGGRVLRLATPSATPTLRLYAHCLRPHAHLQANHTGGVVVFGMNLGPRAISVSLGDALAASPVHQYLLQPLGGDVQARQVLLNGQEVSVGPGGALPPLPPVPLPPGPLTLPPATLGFWALPHAHAPACL